MQPGRTTRESGSFRVHPTAAFRQGIKPVGWPAFNYSHLPCPNHGVWTVTLGRLSIQYIAQYSHASQTSALLCSTTKPTDFDLFVFVAYWMSSFGKQERPISPKPIKQPFTAAQAVPDLYGLSSKNSFELVVWSFFPQRQGYQCWQASRAGCQKPI